MMSRRTEIAILLTILMFSISIVLLPIFINQPYQGITAVDFWAHSTKMRQFDAEGYINYEVDWTNLFRIGGENKYYPPGYPLLLYSFKEIGDLNFTQPSFISLLFAPFFCLLIYLVSRKVFGKPEIALLATFMASCFITGDNMLGPLFPLASTLAVLLILLTLLILLSIPQLNEKVLLSSLFIGTIFITHRATIGAWFLLLPFVAVAPLLITKNRRHFLEHFHYPYMMGTFGGIALSLLYWMNLSGDSIMDLGGILPTGIDELLSVDASTPFLMLFIMLATVTAMFVYSQPIIGKIMTREFEPVVQPKLGTKKFIVLTMILPIVFALLALIFIFGHNLPMPITPNRFLNFWGLLSEAYYSDYSAKVIKQVLYSIHWNILPVMLLVPSIYFYFKSNRRHILLSCSIGALFALVLAFYVQDVLFDVKIQRLYFYVSPFVFFLTAWGGYVVWNEKNIRRIVKKAIVVGAAASIIIVAFTSMMIVPAMPDEKIDGLNWTNTNIPSDSIIASTGYVTQEARGLGQINYVVFVGLLYFDVEWQVMDYLKRLDVDYVAIPPEMESTNSKIVEYNSLYLIFTNGESNVYMIGGYR